jgi:hypothetical protein
MTRKLALIGIGIAVASFAAGAFAQDAARLLGAVPSHHSLERYEMSVGVTSDQAPRRPTRQDEDREVVYVPAHYGTLVGVTGDGLSTVFWYRDAAGDMRNAVVHDTGTRLYKVQCQPTAHFQSDQREK